jgi:hypothetical protein
VIQCEMAGVTSCLDPTASGRSKMSPTKQIFMRLAFHEYVTAVWSRWEAVAEFHDQRRLAKK